MIWKNTLQKRACCLKRAGNTLWRTRRTVHWRHGVSSRCSTKPTSDEQQGGFGPTIDDSKDLTFRRLEALLAKKFCTPIASSTPSSSRSDVDVAFSVSESAPEPAPDDVFPKVVQRRAHGTPKHGAHLFHHRIGHRNMYSHIRHLSRYITGVCSPDPLSATSMTERLEAFTELYTKRTNLINEQDIILGGWSLWGVLAFEVSRQLRRLGCVVKGALLIDSPPQVGHQGLTRRVISYFVEKRQSDGPGTKFRGLKQARLKASLTFQHHATLLQNHNPHSQISDVPCMMLKCLLTTDTRTLRNIACSWLGNENLWTKSIAFWELLVSKLVHRSWCWRWRLTTLRC
ncbi:hypothetical protein GGR52DRAFT_127379 [Hypoxylon sp. FL1284]|nr:hypothetical protein GGR52DRAFT_127379 [Hypoxylon sp. FL1284]